MKSEVVFKDMGGIPDELVVQLASDIATGRGNKYFAARMRDARNIVDSKRTSKSTKMQMLSYHFLEMSEVLFAWYVALEKASWEVD